MSLRLNLIIYIICTLWTSVFGRFYYIHGGWKARVEKCHGEDSRRNNHDIYHQTMNYLPYDYFNEDIIVEAHGVFVLQTTCVKPITAKVLLLNKYDEHDDSKVYKGELHLVGYDWWEKHIAHVGIELIIPRNGKPQVQNYVYAAAWHAMSYCCSTESTIEFLKIVD